MVRATLMMRSYARADNLNVSLRYLKVVVMQYLTDKILLFVLVVICALQ